MEEEASVKGEIFHLSKKSFDSRLGREKEREKREKERGERRREKEREGERGERRREKEREGERIGTGNGKKGKGLHFTEHS